MQTEIRRSSKHRFHLFVERFIARDPDHRTTDRCDGCNDNRPRNHRSTCKQNYRPSNYHADHHQYDCIGNHGDNRSRFDTEVYPFPSIPAVRHAEHGIEADRSVARLRCNKDLQRNLHYSRRGRPRLRSRSHRWHRSPRRSRRREAKARSYASGFSALIYS